MVLPVIKLLDPPTLPPTLTRTLTRTLTLTQTLKEGSIAGDCPDLHVGDQVLSVNGNAALSNVRTVQTPTLT